LPLSVNGAWESLTIGSRGESHVVTNPQSDEANYGRQPSVYYIPAENLPRGGDPAGLIHEYYRVALTGGLSGEGVEELVDRCGGVGGEESLVVLGGDLSCFAGVGSCEPCWRSFMRRERWGRGCPTVVGAERPAPRLGEVRRPEPAVISPLAGQVLIVSGGESEGECVG
jgi:hypothetical protein